MKYLATAGSCVNTRFVLILVFVLSSLATGFCYWLQADWYAYVDMTSTGRGMVPEFKFTLVEQFIASAAIGSEAIWKARLSLRYRLRKEFQLTPA
jgi:hypothetical protein